MSRRKIATITALGVLLYQQAIPLQVLAQELDGTQATEQVEGLAPLTVENSIPEVPENPVPETEPAAPEEPVVVEEPVPPVADVPELTDGSGLVTENGHLPVVPEQGGAMGLRMFGAGLDSVGVRGELPLGTLGSKENPIVVDSEIERTEVGKHYQVVKGGYIETVVSGSVVTEISDGRIGILYGTVDKMSGGKANSVYGTINTMSDGNINFVYGTIDTMSGGRITHTEKDGVINTVSGGEIVHVSGKIDSMTNGEINTMGTEGTITTMSGGKVARFGGLHPDDYPRIEALGADAVIGTIGSGTIGTIENEIHISAGTVKNLAAGVTVDSLSGTGVIKQLDSGNTITAMKGGTIEQLSGGTIGETANKIHISAGTVGNLAAGVTVDSLSGTGVIKQLDSGNTITAMQGGAIEQLNGGTIGETANKIHISAGTVGNLAAGVTVDTLSGHGKILTVGTGATVNDMSGNGYIELLDGGAVGTMTEWSCIDLMKGGTVTDQGGLIKTMEGGTVDELPGTIDTMESGTVGDLRGTITTMNDGKVAELRGWISTMKGGTVDKLRGTINTMIGGTVKQSLADSIIYTLNRGWVKDLEGAIETLNGGSIGSEEGEINIVGIDSSTTQIGSVSAGLTINSIQSAYIGGCKGNTIGTVGDGADIGFIGNNHINRVTEDAEASIYIRLGATVTIDQCGANGLNVAVNLGGTLIVGSVATDGAVNINFGEWTTGGLFIVPDTIQFNDVVGDTEIYHFPNAQTEFIVGTKLTKTGNGADAVWTKDENGNVNIGGQLYKVPNRSVITPEEAIKAAVSVPTDLVYSGESKAAGFGLDVDQLADLGLNIDPQSVSFDFTDKDKDPVADVKDAGKYTYTVSARTIDGDTFTASDDFTITPKELSFGNIALQPVPAGTRDAEAVLDTETVTLNGVVAADADEVGVALKPLTLADDAVKTPGKVTVEIGGELNLTGDRAFNYQLPASVTASLHVLDSFTVTYHGNGAEDSSVPAATTVTENDKVTEPADPTRLGYRFGGWYTDTELTKDYKFSEKVTGNLHLYAKWTANTFTVAFDSNGGVGEMKAKEFTYDGLNFLPVNTFTKKGHYFTGWQVGDDETSILYNGAYVPRLTTEHQGIVTLKARWAPNAFTIMYKANNGTDAYFDYRAIYGAGQEIELYDHFTKAGYHCIGWSKDEQATTAMYTEGQSVDGLDQGDGSETTLYAVWAPNSYQVKFDGNGGIGTMANQQFVYNDGQTLTPNGFTRAGHTFRGWSYTEDGQFELPEQADGNLMATAEDGGEVTLYAVWEENRYTIEFDSNGATPGDMKTQMDILYSDTVNLRDNDYTKPGYRFIGWGTEANGPAVYQDQEEVTSLAGETLDNDRIALFAIWEPIPYAVNFDGDGATGGSMPVITAATDEVVTLPQISFEKTGYHGVGWSLDTNASHGVYAPGATYQRTAEKEGESVTFYAQWEANQYTVKLHPNYPNGGLSQWVGLVYDGPLVKFPAETFSQAGHYLKGWNDQPDGSGDLLVRTDESRNNFTAEKDGEVHLYAQWAPNQHQATFVYGNGTSDLVADTYYGGKVTKPADPFRKGWTFTGWYTTAEELYDFDQLIDGDRTLYADWKENDYSVHFDSNGGSGEMPTQAFTYDHQQKLSANAFTKPGHVFKGWSRQQNGSVAFTDGQEVTSLTDVANGVVTLYAVWEEVHYQIAFYQNDGENDREELQRNIRYSETVALMANTFTRPGYRFKGWGTDPLTETVRYQDKEQVTGLYTGSTPAATVSLYAIWEPLSYQLHYDGNGATSGHILMQEGLTDQALTLAENAFVKPGYHFAGWRLGNDPQEELQAAGADYSRSAGENGEKVTMYAQWQANAYTVNLHANDGRQGLPLKKSLIYDGGPVNFSASTYERTGYRLVGWNDQPDGKGSLVLRADEFRNNFTSEQDGQVDLYAQWTPETYTATFHNGTTTETVATYYDGVLAKPADPSRVGYQFGGWFTDEAGETAYDFGKTVTGELHLYAKWDAISYPISYDTAGGSLTGEITSYTIETDTFTLATPTRKGYSFLGWFEDGSQTPVTAIEKGSIGPRSFTAKWAAADYIATFKGYHGDSDLVVGTSHDGVLTKPADPSRKGHHFMGWFTDEALTKAYDFDGKVSGDLVLYAKWEEANYLVTFKGYHDGGELVVRTVRDELLEKPADPSRVGYQFGGWFVDEAGETTYDFSQVVTGDLVLYAKWDAISYPISYDVAGGSLTGEITSYTIETADFDLAVPSREGYRFVGWFEDGSQTAVTAIEKGSTGPRSFTAKWAAADYTATFKGYHGDSDLVVGTIYDGVLMKPADPNREGDRFIGWFTDEGLTTAYDFSQKVSGDLTLYGKWQAVLAIHDTELPAGQVGGTFSHQFTSNHGQPELVEWTTGGLPPGLNLAESGTITGSPTHYGSFKFYVTATVISRSRMQPEQVTKIVTLTIAKSAEQLQLEGLVKAPVTEEASYTPETWAAYQDALAKAAAAVADPAISHQEIKDHLGQLQEALDGLEKVEVTSDVREELENLLEELTEKDLQAEDYTEETWQDYQEALEEAAALAKDPAATDEDLQGVLDDLQTAYEGLREKLPETGDPKPEDDKGQGGTDKDTTNQDKNNTGTKKPATQRPKLPTTGEVAAGTGVTLAGVGAILAALVTWRKRKKDDKE